MKSGTEPVVPEIVEWVEGISRSMRFTCKKNFDFLQGRFFIFSTFDIIIAKDGTRYPVGMKKNKKNFQIKHPSCILAVRKVKNHFEIDYEI